ncbi:hypothetical protein FISHEDRAFT_46643 [Fistulina hepatica ATCC 64428]|uniref:Zn(2)-C6 fungal-type domain-containing protein n=1 Tax=Fistulina hepatica ATCC 64428 TaxID=1128425 RepID=A0A0D7AA18_9AGAR|nr:hypothetical protein FISHEDRAFT_46643 [Fistulina hepatica ATCC 64428]
MAKSADSTIGSKSNAASLQRGKACLRCRKRKMRCDGAKPACQQCTRAKKGDQCEYDDGKSKTRTQLLREQILRLEQRIRELEDPDYVSPAIVLHDPHGARHPSESESSSLASSTSPPVSNSHAPFSTPPTSHSPFTSQSPYLSGSPYTPGTSSPQPSPEVGEMLLDIFVPHRHQCGLEIDLAPIRATLRHSHTSDLSASPRHAVLLNAIFLWACFVSRPGPLSTQENQYLARALAALPDAVACSADALLDVLQASCLLATYFYATGRSAEASYHAGAAAALVAQHAIHADPAHWPERVLTGERILTFWQVYHIDRVWSALLNMRPVVPDDSDASSAINCPWPQGLAEYASGRAPCRAGFMTVRSMFDGDVTAGGLTIPASRAKAAAILSRAQQLTNAWDPMLKPTEAFQRDVAALEMTVQRFVAALIPVQRLGSALPEARQALVGTHTLANCALVLLYRRLAQGSALPPQSITLAHERMAYDKMVNAARACIAVLPHIAEQDYSFLDPAVGPCWALIADVLLQELDNLQALWPPIDLSASRNELELVLFAMTSMNTQFPILGAYNPSRLVWILF